MRLAIDAMGGDFGPSVIVPAVTEVLRSHSGINAVLFGHQETLESTVPSDLHSRVQIKAAQPLNPDTCDGKQVLLRGRNSSLFKSVQAVAEDSADAVVSAGSTAAMMVAGLRLLGTINGIHRPAICKVFQSKRGNTYLLDLGANAECTPRNLFEFGQLASLLAKLQHNLPRPTVALLSNGTEPSKGTRTLREAARLLSNAEQFEYIGFLEPDSLFDATADVVVCDGFVGNVALKAAESAARTVIGEMKNAIADVGDPILKEQLRARYSQFAPAQHNGAFFLGLNGVIIKSHGGSDVKGTVNSLLSACDLIQHNWLAKHKHTFRTNSIEAED
ncbi:MAG: phosphate acyltransferase PlsX [Pseudomonadota bacterium]